MARIVALLESMWGWGGYNDAGEEAPRFFRINPDNHSGRRLYSLCGDHSLLVTNCCRRVQATANHHGVPDLEWVRENLRMSYPIDLLLVCGRVAKKTFEQIRTPHPAYQILFMDHPAARRWSKVKILEVAEEIEGLCKQ